MHMYMCMCMHMHMCMCMYYGSTYMHMTNNTHSDLSMLVDRDRSTSLMAAHTGFSMTMYTNFQNEHVVRDVLHLLRRAHAKELRKEKNV